MDSLGVPSGHRPEPSDDDEATTRSLIFSEAETDTPASSLPSIPFDGGNKFKLSSGKYIFLNLDSHITPVERQQFSAIEMTFDNSLDRYLRKKKIFLHHGAIGMDLRYVGEELHQARLTIVVSCSPAISSKVKKFFKQDHIRSVFQPKHPTSEDLWFDIDFDNRPPRQRAAVDTVMAYVPEKDIGISYWGEVPDQNNIPRGVLITFGDPDSSITRIGTMGGFITVWIDDKPHVYGITAAHILSSSQSDGGDRTGNADYDDDGDEDEDEDDSDTEEDDNEEDIGFEEETDNSNDLDSLKLIQFNYPWRQCGTALSDPEMLGRLNQNTGLLDWCLVEDVENDSLLSPNLKIQQQQDLWSAVKFELAAQSSTPQRVNLISGVDGSNPGSLTFGTSMLKLDSGRGFTRTHRLTLDGARGIRPGDSGSWVIDIIRREVYGHLVASNAFEEAYIIPIQDTLKQIETALEATAATISSQHENITYRSLRVIESLVDKGNIYGVPPATVERDYTELFSRLDRLGLTDLRQREVSI